jgi:hypothetical protein
MPNTTLPTGVRAHAETLDVNPGDDRHNPRAKVMAARAAQARNRSGRRRLVDPVTTERQYSEAEWEFLQAIEEYKCRSGRKFPTWSEVLEVLQELGYQKRLA